MPVLELYHYWRSSCSWRVRWALNHKKIAYKDIAVDLVKGEQRTPEFLAKNPSGFVPCLKIGDRYLSESLAIIEWIEESYPQNPLLPEDPASRAVVRQLAMTIAAGTQPIQNLKVQKYVSNDQKAGQKFAKHWINEGLKVYEEIASQHAGTYSFGGSITIADLCLIPQAYNGLRFGVDLSQYPIVERIYNCCRQLDDCIKAAPESYQPK